ncbi:MAG: glycosyltransferase family 2 protein [Fibrobacterota bacterium]
MKLSIMIPFLNEEAAAGGVIEATLKASDEIIEKTEVDEVEIVAVNDGSTDKTAEVLSGYNGIKTITHNLNLGYGNALKSGFKSSEGDLIAFFDGDGTCSPSFLVNLVNSLFESKCDIVLGSRLHSKSHMPFIRRLGNRIFAFILRVLTGRKVIDTASGMRVFKRSSLHSLLPLPGGLNFTPAMSAKALTNPDLCIAEVPMPYSERVGESKLGVLKDGLPFLYIITSIAISYHPVRIFGIISLLCFGSSAAYAILTFYQYLYLESIPYWMIYRFAAVLTGFLSGFIFLMTGIVIQRIFNTWLGRKTLFSSIAGRICERIFIDHLFSWGCFFFLAGVVINYPALKEYLFTGHITAPWYSVMAGALFVLTGAQLAAFSIVDYALRFIIRDNSKNG